MPTFPNIGNDFAKKYFEVVSENQRLRGALGDLGRRGISPQYNPNRGVVATNTIPRQIPINTLIALATYLPEVYGNVLVQRFPENFDIIQSSTTARISASSAAVVEQFKQFEPKKDEIIGLSAIQRRPGVYNPSIPGLSFNARRAILAGIDPKTRELLNQIKDLKALTELIEKFTNYARQLELIIEAAGRFITSYITNPLLRKESELQAAILKLQENENKYRQVKRLVQFLVKAYRATKTAIIKALFTDGPKLIQSIKKGYELLRKIFSLPEIPRIRLVLKWPRFPRIWLTIADFFIRIRKLVDALKKNYRKIYEAAYKAAIKQAGFEILDPDDPVLRAFSTAKNVLREVKANVQAVRNTIEEGILQAENKLKQNIRSTVQNVLNEQQRALQKYNNILLSGSKLEGQAIVGTLDATRALRGTAGGILEGVGLYNDVVRAFGGNPKALINGKIFDNASNILKVGQGLETQYGVKPANGQNNTQITGDEIKTTVTADSATKAIQLASQRNRTEALNRGYSEAVGTPRQELKDISVNGQILWEATVISSWAYKVDGYTFDSKILLLPAYVVAAIAAGLVAGVVYPAKVLELYEKTKNQPTTNPNPQSQGLITQNPLNNVPVETTQQPVTLPVYKIKPSEGARLRKDPSIPSAPNSNKTVLQGGNIIRTLEQGTSVELLVGDFVTSNNLTWAKVKLRASTDGNPLAEGWVATRLLDPAPQPFKPVVQQPQPTPTPTIATVSYTPAGGYTFSQAFITELERISGKPIVPDSVKSSKSNIVIPPDGVSSLVPITGPAIDVIEIKTYRPVNGDSSVAAWRLLQEVSTFLKSKEIVNKEEQTERVARGAFFGSSTDGEFIKETILKVQLKAYIQETTTSTGQTITNNSGTTTVYGTDISKTTYKPKNTGVRLRENPSTSSKILETLNTTTQLRYIDGFTQADGETWGKFEIISTKKQGYVSIRLLTPTISLTPPAETNNGAAQGTGAISQQFSTTEYFVNNVNGANIRATPNGNRIKTLQNNTKLKLFAGEQVVSDGNEQWAKFQVANEPTTIGWMAIRLIRPTIQASGTSSAASLPPTSAPPPPPPPPPPTPTSTFEQQLRLRTGQSVAPDEVTVNGNTIITKATRLIGSNANLAALLLNNKRAEDLNLGREENRETRNTIIDLSNTRLAYQTTITITYANKTQTPPPTPTITAVTLPPPAPIGLTVPAPAPERTSIDVSTSALLNNTNIEELRDVLRSTGTQVVPDVINVQTTPVGVDITVTATRNGQLTVRAATDTQARIKSLEIGEGLYLSGTRGGGPIPGTYTNGTPSYTLTYTYSFRKPQSSPAAAQPSTASRKIVFVGDSLAVGTSSNVVGRQNSPITNIVLGTSNVGGPTFLSENGSRIETARVGAATRQIIQFASNPSVQNADVAIISAGSNDPALADGKIDRTQLNALRSTLKAKRYIWIVPIISKARDAVKSVSAQNGDSIVEYSGPVDSAGLHPADGYRSFGDQIIRLLR